MAGLRASFAGAVSKRLRFRRPGPNALAATRLAELDRIEDVELRKRVAARVAWRQGGPRRLLLVGVPVSLVWLAGVLGILFGLRGVVVPWLPAIAAIGWTFGVGWMMNARETALLRRRVRRMLIQHGYPVCLRCGYDLRGITTDRCPECGRPVVRPIGSNRNHSESPDAEGVEVSSRG